MASNYYSTRWTWPESFNVQDILQIPSVVKGRFSTGTEETTYSGWYAEKSTQGPITIVEVKLYYVNSWTVVDGIESDTPFDKELVFTLNYTGVTGERQWSNDKYKSILFNDPKYDYNGNTSLINFVNKYLKYTPDNNYIHLYQNNNKILVDAAIRDDKGYTISKHYATKSAVETSINDIKVELNNKIEANTSAIESNSNNITNNTGRIENLEEKIKTINPLSWIEITKAQYDNYVSTGATKYEVTDLSTIENPEEGNVAQLTEEENVTYYRYGIYQIKDLGKRVDELDSKVVIVQGIAQAAQSTANINTTNISSLTTKVETNTANISKNSSDLNNLDSKITNINNTLTSKTEEIENNLNTTNTEVTKLKETVDSLGAYDLEQIQRDLTAVQNTAATNSSNISSNSAAITTLQQKDNEQDEKLANYKNLIDANTESISTAKGTIPTDAPANVDRNPTIAKNAVDIANLKTSVEQLDFSPEEIQSLKSGIQELADAKQQIETNKTNIANNTNLINTNISELEKKIQTNANNISTNTTSISNLTTNLSNLKGSLSASAPENTRTNPTVFANAEDIATLNNKIEALNLTPEEVLELKQSIEDISAAKQQIEINKNNISSNLNKIEALETRTADIESNLQIIDNKTIQNATDISAANKNIAQNATDIRTANTNIQANADAIAETNERLDNLSLTPEDVQDLKNQVETNKTNIAAANTSIEELKTSVDANKVSIGKIENSVTGLDTRIATNTNNISSLSTSVAANANNISLLTNKINNKQDILSAGENITIEKNTEGNTIISAKSTKTSWGDIKGSITNQIDLDQALIKDSENIDTEEITTLEESKLTFSSLDARLTVVENKINDILIRLEKLEKGE